jgi:Na+/proline symporter
MNKPLLGLSAGAGLGILDGLSALVSAPEVAPDIALIVVGSCGKGLVAGLIIGFFARKVSNLAAGILFGVLTSALVTWPIAIAPNPRNDNEPYFWEIIIPGMLVGLIVGFVTQRYGTRPTPAKA